MADKKAVTLEQLEIAKNYIDNKDAENIKSAEFVDDTLKFYTSEDKSGEAVAEFVLPEEMFLDGSKTELISDFTWDITKYPKSTDPELDGKPVLVLAVKSVRTVRYSFVSLDSVIAKLVGEDTESASVSVAEDVISLNVKVSELLGNRIIIKDDGLYVGAVDNTPSWTVSTDDEVRKIFSTIGSSYLDGSNGSWDNVVMTDANGNKSSMVRIPKMTWMELGVGDSDEIFPAFIVNGEEVSALWIGKYISDKNGASVKGAAPKVSIDFDQSYTLCKNMGDGWHLNTRLSWMAAALWSAKHNCQPTVTTDHTHTGTMDATHSHNGLDSGIWDMAGCKGEWSAGMRLAYGELQIVSADGITFDNSAIVFDSSHSSQNWYCIDGLTGKLMKPNGSGTTPNSLKMNNGQWNISSAVNYYGTIDSITVDPSICEKAKNMLVALGLILPNGITTDGDIVTIYKNSTYVPCVGGYLSNGSSAGVFYVSCGSSRSDTYSDIGLRVAFCEL